MPSKVARFGDPVATGHTCTGVTSIVGKSSNVKANGIGVSFQGAALAVHTILTPATPKPLCLPHGSAINTGLSSVRVNGIPIARAGDSADLGAVSNGSPNVFAG